MSTSALDLVRPLPPLPADDEVLLVLYAQEGDTTAMETIIRTQAQHLWSLAVRASSATASPDDLFAAALVGLMEAVRSFDLDAVKEVRNHGALFGATVRRAVHRAIQDALSEAAAPIRIPARTLRRYTEAIRATDTVEEAREWAMENEGRLSPEDFDTIHAALRYEGLPPGDAHAEDDEVPFRPDLSGMLEGLPEREAEVLRLAYGFTTGEPMTDGAIAARLGVDRSRVVRIRNRALARLRDAA